MPRKPDEPRPWLCAKNHLLGHVEHDGQGMKLLYYRQAINPQDPVPGQTPDVMGVARGVMTVRCSICRREREWHADEKSLQRFLERLDALKIKQIRREAGL
jgi:hypothetical protein